LDDSSRYDDSGIRDLIAQIVTLVDGEITNIKNQISIAGAGTDVQYDLLLERKPTVLYSSHTYNYLEQHATKIFGIWTQGSEPTPVSATGVCAPIYEPDTRRMWSFVTETIPTRVAIPIKVASVPGMNETLFNALPAGTTYSTFPYAFASTEELPEGRGRELFADPPTGDALDSSIGYLATKGGGLIAGIIVGVLVAIADAIPQTKGAAGAVNLFADGLTAISELVVPTDPMTRALLPTGSIPLREWITDADSMSRVVTTYLQNPNGSYPVVRAHGSRTRLSLEAFYNQPGPWVTKTDVSFLGGSRCRLHGYGSIETGYMDLDESFISQDLPMVASGGEGLVGGCVQYRVTGGLNRPTEYSKAGLPVTGWDTIFIDDRPYAYYNGAAWIERPELVEPRLG
jgi:hypothetical protein